MSLLTLIDADVSFGSIKVLQGARMVLPIGVRLGLLGGNGSGKTTLLAVLGGQLESPMRTVWFDGIDISRSTPSQRAHLGLARMFQGSRLWEDLTVIEHLQAMVDVRRPRGASLSTLTKLLNITNDWLQRFPAALTLDQRRRVELCMALFGSRVVLCDELAAGLNAAEAHQLYAAVSRAVQERWIEAALIVEHRHDLLVAHSDEQAVMANGAVLNICKDALNIAMRSV